MRSRRSGVFIIVALLLCSAAFATAPAGAQAKSRQCGHTLRHFGTAKFRFKVWVAHGSTTCTTARTVIARAFGAKPVKGWKCIDATKGGGAPKSYSDECRKGSAIVRADLLSDAAARTARTGRCPDVALTPNIDARVVVRDDACARARSLVRHWLAAGKADGQARRLRKVDGYVCVFGGNTLLVLRCTRGARVVRATWGD